MTVNDWPTDDPVLAEVLDIVAKETGIDRSRLLAPAPIADLDIASLDLVQAIFTIETRFGVEIPVVADTGDAEFVTVGDFVGHVMAQLRTGQAA